MGTKVKNTAEIIDKIKGLKRPAVVSIDGRSGSGKSFLAKTLEESIDDCLVVHLDDYFLRPEQRSKERYEMPGGNVDHERLTEQVIKPFINDRPLVLQKFSCRTMELEEKRTVNAPSLLVLEGSYSGNDELFGYSDLHIFVTCDERTQLERLKVREGSKLTDFMTRWIPLEETYFSACHIRETSELILDTTKKG